MREGQCRDIEKTGVALGRAYLADQFQVKQRRLALLHDDAAVAQRLMAITVKRLAKKPFGRPDRIGAVNDDDIDTVRFGIRHPFDAITEIEAGTFIVIGGAQIGEILLRQPGHALIDLDLPGFLDTVMFQYLTQCTAVTTADDHYPPRIGVRKQRRMRHHFVIYKIIAIGKHDQPVDRHQRTEALGFIDRDFLETGLFLVHLFFHLQ